MLPKEIDKGTPPSAPVIVLKLEPLQKHQYSKHIRVPNGIEPEFARELLAKNLESLLQLVVDAGCKRVTGHGLVIEPALECPVSADERGKRFTYILVDGSPGFHRAAKKAACHLQQQMLMFPQKALRHLDVLIGKLIRVNIGKFLVAARILKVFAFQRTINCLLPFGSAAQGADVPHHAGTIPARPPRFTDLAKHVKNHRIIGVMARLDLHFKVVIDMDDTEG